MRRDKKSKGKMNRHLLLLCLGLSLILFISCELFAGATQTGNTIQITDLTTEDICSDGFDEIESLKVKCENTLEACSDLIDNDLNGKEDCEDPRCEEFCGPDGLGNIKESFLEWCIDGKDNDRDSLIDCEDPDCHVFTICLPNNENTLEGCVDQEDNDGDSLVDCDDPDCSPFEHCKGLPDILEENTYALCSDNKDNDSDGLIDCEDEDCLFFIYCGPPEGENTLGNCMDAIDNDNDGLIDCEDEDCAYLEPCLMPSQEDSYAMCSDGLDNDGDGDVDCDDMDCQFILDCAPDLTTVVVFPDSADVISVIQDMIGTHALGWVKSDGGAETSIENPSVLISSTWGGLFLTSEKQDSIRAIDLSSYFQSKMRFDVKTNCNGDSLYYKSHWEVENERDSISVDEHYLIELKHLIAEDSIPGNVGDDQWYSYEIDFAVATGLSYENSQSIIIPFSLWCAGSIDSVSIEVQNLRFGGESDIECIRTQIDDDAKEKIYCDFSNIKIP